MSEVAAAYPRVVAGVPVYNGQDYLAATLDALLAQDYPNLEILISDNASTDGTGDVAETIVPDNRVALPQRLYAKHLGTSLAMIQEGQGTHDGHRVFSIVLFIEFRLVQGAFNCQ